MNGIHRIARVTHEVNRAYCIATGDHSQPPFEQIPDWQFSSAIAGVRAVLDGTALTPEDQHESWAAQKIAEGWVYGRAKDPVMKTHHCLVPYAELPQEQRVKDYLFRAVVEAMR